MKSYCIMHMERHVATVRSDGGRCAQGVDSPGRQLLAAEGWQPKGSTGGAAGQPDCVVL